VTMNVAQLTRPRRVQWLVLAILLILTPIVQCQQADETSGGTCAVFLQKGKNLALVIDSAVTTFEGGVRLDRTKLACKVWLPNPGIVAATTGILDTGHSSTSWNSTATGRSWLRELPSNPTESQVNVALRGWGEQLMRYLATHPIQHGNGEIASLVVGFRAGGKSHVFRERIAKYDGKIVRDDEESVRWVLNDGGASRLYTGSCRNFIPIDGHRPIEITRSESNALDGLGDESSNPQITSADQLGDLAIRFEELFSQISKNHATTPNSGDEIGPPFQLAVLPADSSEWITSFRDPCK
jgi:hypothetical protein